MYDSLRSDLHVIQALLSAHDTVAQKDYEPVLLPMPDDVPDDEEATRIVCLVKNKQPLVSNTAKTIEAFCKYVTIVSEVWFGVYF